MAGKDNGREISRREFTATLGAVAGLTAGATLLTPTEVSAAPHINPRIIGANDRVVVASIGIRSQGNSAEARLREARQRRGQDALRRRREPLRQPRQRPSPRRRRHASSPATSRTSAACCEDKDVDAVVVATPNHWHALATIWALQAGKHVYVEKPASHTVWEGRQMVEAARKHNRIVQVGTINRSAPAVRQALQFLHEGGLGRGLHGARALLQAAAVHRPLPGRPHGAGRAVTASTPRRGPTSRPTTRPISPRWTTTSGWARRRQAPLQSEPLPLQLALALGVRERRHRQPGPAPVRRRALGPRPQRAPGEDRVRRRPVRSRPTAPRRRRTCTPRSSPTRTGRSSSSRRGACTRTKRAHSGSATCSTARKGWLWIDGDGAVVAVLPRPQGREGPRPRGTTAADTATSTAAPASALYPHFQNFVDAIRAGDRTKLRLRDRGGPSVVVAAAPREHRLSRGQGLTFDARGSGS